jgi:hypothetical protein
MSTLADVPRESLSAISESQPIPPTQELFGSALRGHGLVVEIRGPDGKVVDEKATE